MFLARFRQHKRNRPVPAGSLIALVLILLGSSAGFASAKPCAWIHAGESVSSEWRPLIEGFIRSSQQLRGIVLLHDVRHDPTTDDRQMLDFLSEIGVQLARAGGGREAGARDAELGVGLEAVPGMFGEEPDIEIAVPGGQGGGIGQRGRCRRRHIRIVRGHHQRDTSFPP